jgi:hypothetical protein
MSLLRRPAVSFALALAAAIVTLAPIVTLLLGVNTPGWSHWLCSPATLRSAAHAVGGGGLRVLEVHWPHLLPIVVGLGTLVYLWRADRRYRSHVDDNRQSRAYGRYQSLSTE